MIFRWIDDFEMDELDLDSYIDRYTAVLCWQIYDQMSWAKTESESGDLSGS